MVVRVIVLPQQLQQRAWSGLGLGLGLGFRIRVGVRVRLVRVRVIRVWAVRAEGVG